MTIPKSKLSRERKRRKRFLNTQQTALLHYFSRYRNSIRSKNNKNLLIKRSKNKTLKELKETKGITFLLWSLCLRRRIQYKDLKSLHHMKNGCLINKNKTNGYQNLNIEDFTEKRFLKLSNKYLIKMICSLNLDLPSLHTQYKLQSNRKNSQARILML